MENKKVYLAIPYSGYEEFSFNLANEVAADLIQKGFIVFSPISMSHPISICGKMGGTWEVWKEIDFEFIRWCDEIVVINFDELAINNSVGVRDELRFGREIGKKISYYYKHE